jgi:hypothetical protein
MAWIDESPERYAQISFGDHVCFPFGGLIHFVVMYGPSWVPGSHAACGAKVPDWWKDPKAYPIAGVVDCSGCLAAARSTESSGRESDDSGPVATGGEKPRTTDFSE